MSEATETANGRYKYSRVIFGKTIDEWVQDMHRYNCKENGWCYFPLEKVHWDMIILLCDS